MAENNGRDQVNGRFLTGNNGGPGRQLGSRAKLELAFLDALHADFAAHGASVIVSARTEKPVEYLRVVASVLPKETNVSINRDASEMSDVELDTIIRELAAALGLGGSQRTAKIDPSQLN